MSFWPVPVTRCSERSPRISIRPRIPRPSTGPSWKPIRNRTVPAPISWSSAGYDGMHLIYEALKKSGGSTDGKTLVAAMKGMAWESPRGPMSIDPETGDVVHNIYIRKVEKVSGEPENVEFATFEA